MKLMKLGLVLFSHLHVWTIYIGSRFFYSLLAYTLPKTVFWLYYPLWVSPWGLHFYFLFFSFSSISLCLFSLATFTCIHHGAPKLEGFISRAVRLLQNLNTPSGLNPIVMETCSIIVYSTLKGHKIGEASLDPAIKDGDPPWWWIWANFTTFGFIDGGIVPWRSKIFTMRASKALPNDPLVTA